nr:T9SS type A sorting domain-containing protein [Bacteroidota bacterium]
DGDTDILATTGTPGNKISWFENDGSQNFTERNVKENWYWPRYSTAIDIDQDGDMDIIGTAKTGEVIWFENDGNENFSENVIISNWGEPSSVKAADIDNDADLDILAIAWIGGYVAVFENDGQQNFTGDVFCQTAYEMITIFPIDLDSDGDLDILGANYANDDLRWWENTLITTSITQPEGFNKDHFGLKNYPNPFTSETTICFSIPETCQVELSIFDIAGKLVFSMIDAKLKKGSHTITWNGKTNDSSTIKPGIYYCKIKTDELETTSKMIKTQE